LKRRLTKPEWSTRISLSQDQQALARRSCSGNGAAWNRIRVAYHEHRLLNKLSEPEVKSEVEEEKREIENLLQKPA
jgi:hypothetical protein